MEKETVAPPIDFTNTELAFQAMSNAKLSRTYWMFRMIDNPFLTKVGPKMLTWAFQIGLPVKGVVKNTIFELFVGGESLTDTARTSAYLKKFGVHTIMDYSVEGEKNEKGYEATKEEILRTIDHGHTHEEVAFSALKMTGLASFPIMEKLHLGESLSPSEQEAWDRVILRLQTIAEAASAKETPIFVDAEETWIQDPIDRLVEDLMKRYNQTAPIVWQTIQLYRWDRLAYLQKLIQDSKEKGYILAVKLVRGAYLEKESRRAEEKGYKDPMQPSKEATDRDYDAALALCIENIDHVAVCAGTHNDASSLHLTELMRQKGLEPQDTRIWFAQLLGMSDNISFNLAHAGYNVAKYLPYGPVKAVMPYLMRRAEENTSIAGQSSREVRLLAEEVKRRKV
ncbi:MAG: proline dehydrogenase family protein [Bacteroidota bacterium]